MKKTVLLIMLVLIVNSLSAQEKNKHKNNSDDIVTIFGNKKLEQGGFGALSFGYTNALFDRNAIFTGARGGWIINHWFSYGLGGYSLLSGIHRDIGWDGPDPKSLEFYMGYGGLYIEPAIAPKWPVHITFPILLGVGGAVYVDELNNWDPDNNNYAFWREDADAFVVIEPGLDVEINFVRNLRFGVGVKYRYITDLRLTETDSDALNGLTFSITMKLGKF